VAQVAVESALLAAVVVFCAYCLVMCLVDWLTSGAKLGAILGALPPKHTAWEWLRILVFVLCSAAALGFVNKWSLSAKNSTLRQIGEGFLFLATPVLFLGLTFLLYTPAAPAPPAK